jgi:hypothetical protein
MRRRGDAPSGSDDAPGAGRDTPTGSGEVFQDDVVTPSASGAVRCVRGDEPTRWGDVLAFLPGYWGMPVTCTLATA